MSHCLLNNCCGGKIILNKKLLLTGFIVLTVAILTVGTVSASDVNITDSHTQSVLDDTLSVPMNEELSSNLASDENVDRVLSNDLESDKSNNLSTNSNDGKSLNDVLKSGSVDKSIVSEDVTKYYKGNEKHVATFYDNNGNPLANTQISFTIKCSAFTKTYTKVTDANGVASLAIGLNPGTYQIISNNPVTDQNLTTTVTVLSTINATDITKVYLDGRKFYATFVNADGSALANTYVKFKLNGNTYSSKTDAKGVASLSVSSLNVGTYKVISYNIDGLTRTNSIKVIASTTSQLITTSYTFSETDKKIIKVTLHNGLGYAPNAGKTVKVTINGVTYSATTDSNGVASFTLPYSLAVGSYNAKYTFAGNSFYSPSSATDTVTIKESNSKLTVTSPTTFIKGEGAPLQVTLTSEGTPLAGKEVIFKLGTKSYTRITDSNGVASLPIGLNVGKYTFNFEFAGEGDISPCSASVQISVVNAPAPVDSKITVVSPTTFIKGAGESLKVSLTSGGKALVGKEVVFKLGSKSYNRVTDSNGVASLPIGLAVGKYTFYFEFAGEGNIQPSSLSVAIEVVKTPAPATNGYGYWVFGADMKNVDLNSLASKGTTDLFLNYYAIETHGKTAVESWIAKASNLGIRVHIWMQSFYDGGWINPVKDGQVNQKYFNEKIAEAESYAAVKGVAGIHLDYLRYPGNAYKTTGGTEAINTFVKQIVSAIRAVNPNLIISAALMPECDDLKYYYGQDYDVISKYMDAVLPMVYKGNYEAGSAWITSTSKWFVEHSKGAKVWTGLQGYESDSHVVPLPSAEIKHDAEAALKGKSDGVIIFRWGVTNFVDFKSLSPSTTVTISEILAAASDLKSTIDSTKAVPKTVKVGGVSYSTAQFLYMMGEAITQINAGKTSSEIVPISAIAPASPSDSYKSGSLSLAKYVDVASRVSKYIINNGGQVPNYASSDLGNIGYDSLVKMFATILVDYKVNAKLPSSIKLTSNSMLIGDQGPSTPPINSSVTTPIVTGDTIAIDDILSGASNVKKFIADNGRLPNTVTVAGTTFSMAEFTYLMTQAIYHLGNSNNSNVIIISGVNEAENPTSGDSINSVNLEMEKYITAAFNVGKYIKDNNQAPNYVTTDIGKICYDEYVDAFARVLAFYVTEGVMPNWVNINTASGSSSGSLTATGTGLNEINTATDLSKYLVATTNCQVDNSRIKAIVDSVTAGLTSVKDKAVAIYNYVRDYVSYKFYYNTEYSATGTLSAKSGNCVDQAHLVVAMLRTADIPARYVHGTCTFTSSGSTYGHVWAQVLVDDMWYVIDPTSSRNSFGKIVNWYTSYYTIHTITNNIQF
ncbi:MAG: pseudomurein-binding repeat-containing protein [Methanobrevibacter sp.]|uniref:pseudomurein-binding repeat-containing protein n=1 Tax=Methanobrevibacter sp. TaxID=66852 RepID=UPI003F0018AA